MLTTLLFSLLAHAPLAACDLDLTCPSAAFQRAW